MPMQLGRTRLTTWGETAVPDGGTVFLLWSTRSPLSALSGKRPSSSVNRRKLVSRTLSSTYYRVLTPAAISTPDQEVSVKVLMDPGVSPLASPIEAQALDGSLLFKVTYVTVSVNNFRLSQTHTQKPWLSTCVRALHIQWFWGYLG